MKNKILFIDQYKSIGGGQISLMRLIDIALTSGMDVTAMFPCGGELERIINWRFGNRVKIVNIQEINLNNGQKNIFDIIKLICYLFPFFRCIRYISNNYTIYVNSSRLFPFIYLFSFFINRKYIYHLHLTYSKLEKFIIYLITKNKNTYKVIANSKFTYLDLCSINTNLIKNKKLCIIENCLSGEYSSLSYVNRFKENAKKFNIAIIGRVSKEKGQDVVLFLSKIFSSVDFYIIGDSDFIKDDFMKYIADNSPNNVIFYGKTDNVISTINKIPIHFSLVPSICNESFGLVAIESMACSCITITSNLGGLSGISKKTGSIAYNSINDLVDILKKLFEKSFNELSKISYSQYLNTNTTFNSKIFSKKMKKVLKI